MRVQDLVGGDLVGRETGGRDHQGGTLSLDPGGLTATLYPQGRERDNQTPHQGWEIRLVI